MKIRLIVSIASFCLALAGCGKEIKLLPESEEKAFKAAQQLLREGKGKEALRYFIALTQKRPDAAISHLEAGNLFLRIENDPIEAIHHLRRYLSLCPNSKNAPLVIQLIETAKKEFLRQLPGNPIPTDSTNGVNFSEAVQQLREENKALKHQLAATQGKVDVIAPTARSKKTNSNANLPRKPSKVKTYTIVGGDTLSKISIKVYGVPHRWKEIFEANRALLKTPNNLRVGMNLQIP